jgi:predicted RNase H-like HicB family nuclease
MVFSRGVKMKTFTAYVEWDPETKLYVGIVPGVSGAHTQGATLDELQKNLKEVLELCLEEAKKSGELGELPQFIGVQQIEVAT